MGFLLRLSNNVVDCRTEIYMSERQNKRIEKGEIQTQYKSGSRYSRAYSTSKPNYQWVSSTKVIGRGGESDSTGPSTSSDTHSSVNNSK